MSATDEMVTSIKKQAMDLEHGELIDIFLTHILGGVKQEQMMILLERLSSKGKRFFLETAMLRMISGINEKEGDK